MGKTLQSYLVAQKKISGEEVKITMQLYSVNECKLLFIGHNNSLVQNFFYLYFI